MLNDIDESSERYREIWKELDDLCPALAGRVARSLVEDGPPLSRDDDDAFNYVILKVNVSRKGDKASSLDVSLLNMAAKMIEGKF